MAGLGGGCPSMPDAPVCGPVLSRPPDVRSRFRRAGEHHMVMGTVVTDRLAVRGRVKRWGEHPSGHGGRPSASLRCSEPVRAGGGSLNGHGERRAPFPRSAQPDQAAVNHPVDLGIVLTHPPAVRPVIKRSREHPMDLRTPIAAVVDESGRVRAPCTWGAVMSRRSDVRSRLKRQKEWAPNGGRFRARRLAGTSGLGNAQWIW